MAGDVTLNDVAQKSGVSLATASRALNGRDGVRDDVRERVEMIAQALGYRPNRAAKNLAGGRTSVIGLILGSHELQTDVYAASLVQAVARAADRHDEGLMLILDTKEPGIAVQHLLRDGLIDGVIVSAVAIGQRWVEQLLDARIPTVLVGAHPRRSDVNVIDVENRHSSAELVGRLLDSGCSRVAAMTGPLDRVDASLRLEGFRDAHAARGLEVDESLIVNGDFTRAFGYEAAPELLDRHPDAVVCANDETALGLLRRAAKRGLRVPEDLSVTGFDGTSITDPGSPRVTSMLQPFDELAETAVLSLIRLVDGRDVSLEQVVTPEILVGDTTRPEPEDEEG